MVILTVPGSYSTERRGKGPISAASRPTPMRNEAVEISLSGSRVEKPPATVEIGFENRMEVARLQAVG